MLFYFPFLLSPDPTGSAGGASGTEDPNKEKDKETGGKSNDETITMTKSEFEAKLNQKYAEGARKAQTTGGNNNTQNPENTGQKEKNGENGQAKTDEFVTLKNEVELLRGEKLALKQGVKTDYAEDAVAILKGKGLEINEANMKSIVDKHPEWKTSNDEKSEGGGAKPLGSAGGKSTPPATDEATQAAKMFGL